MDMGLKLKNRKVSIINISCLFCNVVCHPEHWLLILDSYTRFLQREKTYAIFSFFLLAFPFFIFVYCIITQVIARIAVRVLLHGQRFLFCAKARLESHLEGAESQSTEKGQLSWQIGEEKRHRLKGTGVCKIVQLNRQKDCLHDLL